MLQSNSPATEESWHGGGGGGNVRRLKGRQWGGELNDRSSHDLSPYININICIYIWPCDINSAHTSIGKCGENVWGTIEIVSISFDLLVPKRDLNQNTGGGCSYDRYPSVWEHLKGDLFCFVLGG